MRAALAVPSAESPSTMNSSVRSLSVARQSASLAGSAEDSSAFLRRWVSLCWRAASRVFDAPDDLLHQQLGLGLLGPLGGGEERLELGGDDLAHDAARGRRAEDLLGLALELRLGQPHGDHRGQALQHVVLDDVGVVDLERLGGAHRPR